MVVWSDFTQIALKCHGNVTGMSLECHQLHSTACGHLRDVTLHSCAVCSLLHAAV